MTVKHLPIIVGILACLTATAQESGKIEYTNEHTQWADSVLNTLTIRQKVAQLIMMAVYSNKTESYNQQTIELFDSLQFGGIIFMQGGPVRQALLCNRIQERLTIPAMVAIDAEYGLGMRLDSTIYYPRAMALGAISDRWAVYKFGTEVARQCRRLGIHINFAPVLDINVEPKNPIINSRSFGEDKRKVSQYASAYATGLQAGNVMAVGKHFPGHGDTHTDSHLALPLVPHDTCRLNDIELFPFKDNADLVGGMLVAHLAVPALEPDTTLPSTLSKRIVDSLLINEMNYKGLIFTDALNMRGVANAYEPGTLEVKAFMAGNDILLFPQKAEIAIDSIEKAIADSLITIDELNRRCRKVLLAKAWMGLNHYQPIDTANLYSDLNSAEAKAINDGLTYESLTLVKNDDIFPIKKLTDNKILSISINGGNDNVFQKTLKLYAELDTICLSTLNDSIINKTVKDAKRYNTIIVSTLGTNELQNKNFGLDNESIRLIDTLALRNDVILVHLGNPYALDKLQETKKIKAILVGYRAIAETQSLSAQAVFGGIQTNGHLSVSVNDRITEGCGSLDSKQIRLSYIDANGQYIRDDYFSRIDSIINQCIKDKIMPGCQLAFGINGNVVYNKAFGYHTYDSINPVKLTDIYDIASVTKVVATTTALMQLYDKKQFKLNDKLSDYVPLIRNSNKNDLKINQIMTHQAGLKSWIPFYKSTFDAKGKLRPDLYSNKHSDIFNIKLTDSLFLRTTYTDTIYKAIVESEVSKNRKYLYSDLGFYLFPLMIEHLTGMSIDKYCEENIFKPLGMNSTGYLPLQKFDTARIVPSEIDREWRNDTLLGYVNDQGASMIGGISGHAGLFSNASDLAKICQMWLNEGSYGGTRLIDKNTLKTFTTAPFAKEGNRRALGFDRPLKKYSINGPTCKYASQKSFGHTGFTGPLIWIDPEYDCFMVFVTNRTFPSSKENRLANLNIRTQIQEIFYKAIIDNNR